MIGQTIKQSFYVEGMTCAHCCVRIKEELSKIEGIKTVKADLKTGEVLVSCKKELDFDCINKKLKELGYKIKK